MPFAAVKLGAHGITGEAPPPDTEAEPELAAAFAIKSIPSMLFCSAEEAPQMANGALPKAELERIIADVLKVEKPA